MAALSVADRVGRVFFRWRGPIGFLGYVLAFWLGRPTITSCLFAIPLLLAGTGLRVWAMGYIGVSARAVEIGGGEYVGAGPYRWFRLRSRSPAGHPLYVGNLCMVVGVLTALSPPVLFSLLVIGVFLGEYWLMARTEERELIRGSGGKARHDVRFESRRALPEWRTAAVVAAAYGLAFLKALVVRA